MPEAIPNICVCTAPDVAVLHMSELLTTTLGALAVEGVLLVTTVDDTVFVSADFVSVDTATKVIVTKSINNNLI